MIGHAKRHIEMRTENNRLSPVIDVTMPPANNAQPDPDRHDGHSLLGALDMALAYLKDNIEPINRLNVFPVPDGDTGTNMYFTLKSAVDAAHEAASESAAQVARAAYDGALLGARGNSGVILSQIMRGISLGLQKSTVIAVPEMASAFCEAARAGYDAVAEPVEGTMLTVARRAGEAAQAAADNVTGLNELLTTVTEAARDAVAKTPEQLEVLRQAGVVDAGGEGVAVVYDGLRMFFNGEDLPESAATGRDETVFAEFAAEHAGDEHGFCTQFLLDGEGMDLEEMRSWMATNADSAVVVGDEKRIRVHVHTEMPGQILNYAVPMGSVSRISIENMDLQQDVQFAGAAPTDDHPASLLGTPTAGLVAVAAGDGFERLFADFGATVVAGGQTMNPSVAELAAAIAANTSDEVVVLPNNKNIILAAKGASSLSEKRVKVLPTRSLPEGIAAVVAYVPNREFERNVAAMEDAMGEVVTIELTQAVRDATVDDVAVSEGQYMCLVDGSLGAADDDREAALRAALSGIDGAEPETATVYWGASTDDAAAAALEGLITDRWPEVEFDSYPGGQDHYDFVIALE